MSSIPSTSGTSGTSGTSSATQTATLVSTIGSGSSGTPTFNISGLASGLDTNAIVQQLMQIAQIPQQNIINQTTLETARQNDLKTIQTQVANLSTAVSQLVDPSTWSTAQQVSSSDPTRITATGSGVPPGGFQISVQQLARAAQLTQTTALSAANGNDQLTIQVGSGTAFNVNVKAGDSLQTIADEINAGAGTQLFASVVNSKLVLSSQQTGAANTIAVTSTGGGTLAADLGLNQTVAPQDALYTVDSGSQQSSSSNSVTTIATGLTVTFQGVTSNPVSVAVAQAGPNVQGVQNALQNFVTVYNQTVDMINAKLSEQKVANPTTDAERAQGDLNGDSSLTSLLQQLRESVGSAFAGAPGAMSTLSQAGLSTGAAVGSGMLNQSSIDGDLQLDTGALTTALTTQFQNVKNLFTNVTNSFNSEGLAQRLNGVIQQYTGPQGVLPSEISGESSLISSLNDQKAEWDVRLQEQQTALQAKFANMESALATLQSQGNYLSSQIAKL